MVCGEDFPEAAILGLSRTQTQLKLVDGIDIVGGVRFYVPRG